MLPLLTPAIEALLKLFEGISNLKKTKLQNSQTIFKEIVEPLFEELEPVSFSYVDFFRKSRAMIIENQQDNLLAIARRMRENRDAMLMARIKVSEMANQIKEYIRDEDVINFALSVEHFFYGATNFPQVNLPWKTKAISFIEFLEYAAVNQVEKSEIIEHLNEILGDIENEWASVIRSYEKVKIHSTTPQEFINKHNAKNNKSQ